MTDCVIVLEIAGTKRREMIRSKIMKVIHKNNVQKEFYFQRKYVGYNTNYTAFLSSF